MVAPTRTPEARGAKCSLCQKILVQATWLDQTKLAKSPDEALSVLSLFDHHKSTECPCIPNNIENLLIGSTHFEVHRLLFRSHDIEIHKRHSDYINREIKVSNHQHLQNQQTNKNINDCMESSNDKSRFKIYAHFNDQKNCDKSSQQLRHLKKAIDYWLIALTDSTSPFNSKLALRLGLTHHVIYACYLFKYYRLIDYQLITANLLLNIFKLIEGVTMNAQLHAYFLLVKALIDCQQLKLAKQYLKQAIKSPNYQDKTHYESILLACVECEISIIEGNEEIYNQIDELAKLAIIQENDKLQHYYARTLALSLIINYIHCYPARSELCFEFYHVFRYICAIIRRCYQSSFDLIFQESTHQRQSVDESNNNVNNDNNNNYGQFNKQQTNNSQCNTKGNRKSINQLKQHQPIEQILDHSWIRFAACDLVFTSFDLLTDFYIRAGHPENLELLFNGLNLVAYRSSSCYWQAQMASIGSSLDIVCDKFSLANTKLESMSKIIGYTNDGPLMNLLRLDLEISSLWLHVNQNIEMKSEIINDLLQRLNTFQLSISNKFNKHDLYDCKSGNYQKLLSTTTHSDHDAMCQMLTNSRLRKLYIKLNKIHIISTMFHNNNTSDQDETSTKKVIDILIDLNNNLNNNLSNCKNLQYQENQNVLEMLLQTTQIHKSDQLLLEAINQCKLFIESGFTVDLESQLSLLTISSDGGDNQNTSMSSKRIDSKRGRAKSLKKSHNINHHHQISSRSRGRHKAVYDVASRYEENLPGHHESGRITSKLISLTNTLDLLKNIESLSREEIVNGYLRNSEPTPDYLLYRKAHELLFAIRLRNHSENNTTKNHDQLLYHFCESQTANTMRYRWMMSEEQHLCPFESVKSKQQPIGLMRLLAFNDRLINCDKLIKAQTRHFPDSYRLVQMKSIIDIANQIEHCLIVSFDASDNNQEPIYLHTTKSISSDNFLQNDSIDNKCEQLTVQNSFKQLIENAKKTLFIMNNRIRTDKRQEFETELCSMLNSIENELLGCFRFVLCGKILDEAYQKLVDELLRDIDKIMSESNLQPISYSCLRATIESGLWINRDVFCKLLSYNYHCPPRSEPIRSSYGKWLKTIETHLEKYHDSSMTKTSFAQSLKCGQVGLILDQQLEQIPFESLPLLRTSNQGIFRVPSFRVFCILTGRIAAPPSMDNPYRVDPDNLVYILDPANDLAKTRERFDCKLKSHTQWLGCIGKTPTPQTLESWFRTREIYLYIGHGAGMAYYNKLSQNKGLNAIHYIKTMAIVMGCSSGRIQSHGPKLEAFGVNWIFIMRGSPSYVGLLWDVTDTDIDRFLDSFLDYWFKGIVNWSGPPQTNDNNELKNNKVSSLPTVDCLTSCEAIAKARHICQLKFLVGSTPVVYGLPLTCYKTDQISNDSLKYN